MEQYQGEWEEISQTIDEHIHLMMERYLETGNVFIKDNKKINKHIIISIAKSLFFVLSLFLLITAFSLCYVKNGVAKLYFATPLHLRRPCNRNSY